MAAQSEPHKRQYSRNPERGANGHAKDDARTQQERLEAEFDARVGPPPESPAPREIALEWWADIEADDEDDLIAGVLPREGVAALYAPPSAGKSVVALDLAGRLAKGMDVFGKDDAERVGVIYCALEGQRGVRRRIKAMKERYGSNLPVAVVTTQLDFRTAQSGDVQAFIEKARAASAVFARFEVKLGLVVIDTLAAATPGMNESSSEGMTAAIGAMQAIQAALGGLVLLNAHPGKDTERGLRGHSSLLAAVDTSLEITWDGESEHRELWIRKQKDGACNQPLATFTIETKVIGETKKGHAVTGALANWGPPPTPQDRPSKRTSKRPAPGAPTVRKALEQLISEKGERPPAICQAGAQYGVQRDALRDRAHSLGLTDPDAAPATRRQAFKRAMDYLREASAEIQEREGWVWFNPRKEGVTKRDTSRAGHAPSRRA